MDLTDDLLYSARDRDLVVQKIQKSDRGHKLNTIKVVEGRGPICRVDGKMVILSRNGLDIQILDDDQVQFKRIGNIKVRTAAFISVLLSPIQKKLEKKNKKKGKTDGNSCQGRGGQVRLERRDEKKKRISNGHFLLTCSFEERKKTTCAPNKRSQRRWAGHFLEHSTRWACVRVGVRVWLDLGRRKRGEKKVSELENEIENE